MGKIFQHHSNTEAWSNWFCPVPLLQGGKDFPSGHYNSSRKTHLLSLCSGADKSQCRNMWKVRWERRACHDLQGKRTHSKSDAQGQPNSAGCAGFTPESSMRDSWSPKQFPLHGFPTSTSPHFRLRHILLFCDLWWMPPLLSSHPTLACGHLSGLRAEKSARLQTKLYVWSRISGLCR